MRHDVNKLNILLKFYHSRIILQKLQTDVNKMWSCGHIQKIEKLETTLSRSDRIENKISISFSFCVLLTFGCCSASWVGLYTPEYYENGNNEHISFMWACDIYKQIN